VQPPWLKKRVWGSTPHFSANRFKAESANREDTMTILNRLFGKKATSEKTKPFYANAAREQRQEWFARTPPWNRVNSTVIDAILDGITDKVLLEVFVLASMDYGLVARYEPLGREKFDSPEIIRAQISHILCQTGTSAIPSLAKALETTEGADAAKKAVTMAVDTFEPAIALAKNQIAAYVGMAIVSALVGKRVESHDWAKRGLVEVANMRRLNPPFHRSAVFRADILGQMERQLRALLA
jgi:hypothetical protein